MAHKVELLDKGMSKGAPWHIGETRDRWLVVDKTYTPASAGAIGWERQDGEEGIWNPRTVPAFARAGGQDFVLIPGSHHTVRDDMPMDSPQRFLSMGRGVGDNYTLITNQDIIDYANALCDGGAHVDSCGSIMNGQRVFLSLFLPDGADIEGEEAANHLLLTTAHDGTACFEALLAIMLTVCYNTLQWNRKSATTRYKIRHTLNATTRMMEAEKIIKVAGANFGSTVKILRALAKKRLTDQQARDFIESISGFSGEGKRSENARDAVLELYHGRQIAADSKARKGTLFGAINAFNQWIEQGMTINRHADSHGEKRDEGEARFNSVIFGAGARKRDEVMNAAAAML